MSAQTILKMIESVDPNDKAGLDDIDTHVEWYLHPKRHPFVYGQRYTRSRDALKAIRPEGMTIRLWAERGDAFCCVNERQDGERKSPLHPYLKTEELAELHAIIQAIEYERTK